MTRPTTQRVVTPKDRQRRRDEVSGEIITVTVAGRAYTVCEGDVCAADVIALRRATGHSFRGLLSLLNDDMDIDVLASVVWLARRAEGERSLTFDEVASQITYEDIDEEPATVDDEESPPEP